MKYLIVGLGNVGSEYLGSRHNVGFRIVNAVAEDGGATFGDYRYGAIARMRLKNKELILLKPNTFMNLSGLAVRYWMQKEKIALENLLIVVDDLALPLGTLRLKPQGNHGGHNGLRNISETLATDQYNRLRFGIGDTFSKGRQVNYVLGQFEPEEMEVLPGRIKLAVDMIKSFCLSGVQFAMNNYNNK